MTGRKRFQEQPARQRSGTFWLETPTYRHLTQDETIDEAEQTMLANLKEKTGHSLDEWKALLAQHALAKHGGIAKFL